MLVTSYPVPVVGPGATEGCDAAMVSRRASHLLALVVGLLPGLGLVAFLSPSFLVPALAADAPWWNRDWGLRHRLEIPAALPPFADAAFASVSTFGRLRADGGDLRVVSAKGEVMPHRLLGVGPGHVVSFLFGVRAGETTYFAYLGNPRAGADSASEDFAPKAGLVLEVRDLPAGPFVHAPEIMALWDKATEVQGRTLVDRIFHGTNPVGPAETFIARYSGHVLIPRHAAWRVVTASSDASCVLVDGKVVAQWGGVHPAAPGRTGRFGAAVDLLPGPHRVDYYWVKADDAAPPTAVLGIQDPNEEGPRLVQPPQFVQPARAKVFAAERLGGARLADFAWGALYHLENNGLFGVGLRLVAAPDLEGGDDAFVWSFPDGSKATGREVQKVFFGVGAREVTLTWTGMEGEVSSTLGVVVEPSWSQVRPPEGLTLDLYAECFDAVDPAVASTEALLAMLALADDLDRAERIPALWDTLRGRAEARSMPGFARVCEVLGSRFLQAPFLSAEKAEEALRLGVTAAKDDVTRLRCLRLLADLLVNAKGDADGAAALLPRLAPLKEDKRERRALRILEGDVAAQRGDAETAAARYDEAGATARPWDPKVSLKRSALLFSASEWLEAGAFAGAAEAIEDWLQGQPQDRMDPQMLWLLGRAQAGLAFQGRAAVLFERALALDPWGPHASKLLLDLADLRRRMGDAALARAHEALLLERFPYSEEAARLHARRKGIRYEGDDG